MNKKMREILSKIESLSDIANKKLECHEIKAAEDIISQIEDLEKEYVIAEKLFNKEKSKVEDITQKDIEDSLKEKKANGFTVLAKLLTKKNLSDIENAIVIESDNLENPNGTNYIVPEDVRTEINALKRNFVSAKEIVNVIPVLSLSGSQNFEKEDDGLLLDFTDGGDVGEGTDPKIDKVSWNIKFKGNLIFISNIVLGNEKANLLSYLNKWFVKKAVRTENKDIFKNLIKEKTQKTVKGLMNLKKTINKMDPSLKINGYIVTNSSGFAAMDEETDKNGRPMLQLNPSDLTTKMFQSMPIKVFSDSELENIGEKYPIIVGDTKAGCDFYDRENYDFATSEHYKFNKNQTTLRVMEGYDVQQTDKGAYEYLIFEAKEESPAV